MNVKLSEDSNTRQAATHIHAIDNRPALNERARSFFPTEQIETRFQGLISSMFDELARKEAVILRLQKKVSFLSAMCYNRPRIYKLKGSDRAKSKNDRSHFKIPVNLSELKLESATIRKSGNHLFDNDLKTESCLQKPIEQKHECKEEIFGITACNEVYGDQFIDRMRNSLLTQATPKALIDSKYEYLIDEAYYTMKQAYFASKAVDTLRSKSEGLGDVLSDDERFRLTEIVTQMQRNQLSYDLQDLLYEALEIMDKHFNTNTKKKSNKGHTDQNCTKGGFAPDGQSRG